MLGKGLHHCFSRLKRPSHSAPPPIANSEYTPSTSASASASSASVVFKNFNSLYDPTASSDSETLTLTLTTLSSATAASSSSSSSSASASASLSLSLSLSLSAAEEGPAPAPAHSPSPSPSERDLSTAIASRRFFPASPGRSKSIVDSAAVAVVGVGVGTGVAVPTYSPDPYGDFRRSMEEMVAALGLDAAPRRTHLHELLLCYLALNSKRAHKYIIGAFADLLLGLAAPAAPEDCLDASS